MANLSLHRYIKAVVYRNNAKFAVLRQLYILNDLFIDFDIKIDFRAIFELFMSISVSIHISPSATPKTAPKKQIAQTISGKGDIFCRKIYTIFQNFLIDAFPGKLKSRAKVGKSRELMYLRKTLHYLCKLFFETTSDDKVDVRKSFVNHLDFLCTIFQKSFTHNSSLFVSVLSFSSIRVLTHPKRVERTSCYIAF